MPVSMSGSDVSRCFATVNRFGEELQSFNDEVAKQFERALSDEKYRDPFALAGKLKKHWDWNNDLVCDGVASNYPLRKSGRGKHGVSNYLGWQVGLFGPCVTIPGFDPEPLVHMYCFEDSVDFTQNSVAFPLDRDDELWLDDDRLLMWGSADSDWCDRGWCFSLRLLELGSPDDIRDFLVGPAMALLRGGGAKEHLAAEAISQALVVYPSIEKLTSSTD